MEELDMKHERRYCSRLGWALLFVLIWSVAWQFVIYAVDYEFGFPDTAFYLLTLVGPYLVSLPAAFLIAPRKRVPAQSWIRTSLPRFGNWLIAGCSLMTFGQIIGTAMESLIYKLIDKESVSLVGETMEELPITAIVLGVCVIGPVCEELLFRGLAANRLSLYGELPAALISSFLFAMFHGNFGQFFYAFGLGMLLSYAYFRSNRIAAPVFLHMLFNIYGGLLPVVFSCSDIALGLYLIADILIAAAGLIVLFRTAKRLLWKNGLYPAYVRIMFLNPGIILLILSYIAETVSVYVLS